MSIATSPSLPLPQGSTDRSRSPDAARRNVVQTSIPARRHDLVIQEQQHEGQTRYFVKDPLSLKYFRFAPAEFLVFQLLDGKRTLQEVRHEFARQFTLQDITDREILALVQRWQQANLLQESGDMASTRVLAAQQRARASRWFGWMSNILYMKIRAFDPDPLLNRIYPWVRWLFQPIGICLALGTMISAALLVTARFEEFTSQPELRDFNAFFNLQNIFWLWLAVGIVKVLHEFGHGLTCKHFGGECHAMGLLFMCFTPCMYCDVSDSWMLPNKWHRIAIAAAGIYVELLIAALATFVWWTTAPGVLHSVAFSAMVFGSIQTILINANPLMRFDGYYVMSDYLEVPNLRQKSYTFTKYYLKRWFWGTREAAPGSGGLPFVMYALTASFYRVLLTAGMIWFFSKVLEPYKLAAVGWVLAALAATNIVVVPVVRAIATAIRNPAAMRPRSWWRPFLALALLAGVAAAFFYLPLPRRAYAVLTLEPAQSELISTSSRGTIVRHRAAPGSLVRQGDPVLELENAELRLQADRMEQQRDLLRVQVRVATALLDPARAQPIQVALTELESQLAVLHRRIEELVLRAPCDGRVIAEPGRESLSEHSPSLVAPLGNWQRTVLHDENIGAVLEPGTAVCRIAATDECVAIAVLSQTQVESVQVGQGAAIKLDAFPRETFLGTVQEISVQDVDQVAPQLLNLHGSELPAIATGPSAGQLAETHYRIRIHLDRLAREDLDHWPARFRTGLRGRVWIQTGYQTAAQATWRWVCQVLQW